MIQLGLFGDDKEVKASRKARPTDQPMLFSAREILQFGVRAHPLMPLSPKTQLELIMEDPRTEAEKERDLQRAAEALTKPIDF